MTRRGGCRYKRCKKAVAEGAKWGTETTVGAGLPIINVLQTDLIGTGDKVKTIEVSAGQLDNDRCNGSWRGAGVRRQE